jgi:aryl-alcohol dehydrogenase-like predicted oxidoreductase
MGGHGWGDVSRNSLIDAINHAIDIGVNFFDTSDTYGLGEGEQLLGFALGDRRKEVVIASKFGVRVENGKTFYDNSPEWIEIALEKSLKRLNTTYIDLYQIHYRDNTPLSTVFEKLEELKQVGKIRYYGLSNIHLKDLPDLEKYKGKFVSFQDEYSLVTRKNENDLFSLSRGLDITPMTWGSLGQGILSGKYNKDTVFEKNDRRSRKEYINFHGDKFIKNLEVVEQMKSVAFKYGKSLASVAIRWILDYIPDSIVIAGIKDLNQLEMNASALKWSMKKEDIDFLDIISKEQL